MESCMCEPKKSQNSLISAKEAVWKKVKEASCWPKPLRSCHCWRPVYLLLSEAHQHFSIFIDSRPLGKLLKLQSKYLRGRCIEMVGHLQSCYSFGATNSTFFPCPVSIKCRPKHRYSWSRGCMFLVHMWHVAVVADGIFACKDMKLEKYLVVHPRGAVGQVINRPILFSSLNLQVAHLWQNRLGGEVASIFEHTYCTRCTCTRCTCTHCTGRLAWPAWSSQS